MADGEEQGQPGGRPEIPAGRYPDPNTGGQRYWDGSKWTEYTDQNDPAQPAGSGPFGVALGLIGLVLSIIFVSTGDFDFFFDLDNFDS